MKFDSLLPTFTSLLALASGCATQQANVLLCGEEGCSLEGECEHEAECPPETCCTEGAEEANGAAEIEEHVAEVTDTLVASECCGIPGLYTYQAVFLGGALRPEDLEKLESGGVRTIVDLRTPSEGDFDEKRVAEDLGFAYHNPGFRGAEQFTDAILDETRGLLREGTRPLVLHCASGNRVGAVWLAYRMLDEGVELETALTEARTVGLRSPGYEERALEYVRARSSR